MKYDQYCDELGVEVDRFAGALANVNWAAPVPSCPDWTVRDLTKHLGTVHRWAQQLVHARATERIPRSQPDGADVEFNEDWLRSGGHSLVVTLRSANPEDSMWAWGADQHVRFWARRQLHETLVHRIDLELAMDVASSVDPVVAVDAVDEYLANLKSDRDIRVKARTQSPEGERMEIRTKDSSTSWGVVLSDETFEFVDTVTNPDVVLIAEPAELLSLLLRRRPLERCEVLIDGDESLVGHWLRETGFQ